MEYNSFKGVSENIDVCNLFSPIEIIEITSYSNSRHRIEVKKNPAGSLQGPNSLIHQSL
jgi:hypothetical protein